MLQECKKFDSVLLNGGGFVDTVIELDQMITEDIAGTIANVAMHVCRVKHESHYTLWRAYTSFLMVSHTAGISLSCRILRIISTLNV
jgi:hypothetical protein